MTNPERVERRANVRLVSQFALGIMWLPLGGWASVLLANHVFALLGCASPNAPEPVTPSESAAAALATALLTLTSLSVCRREEDPWPRTEWPFILAVIVTGAVSLLSGLLAVVLATDVSLPNSPDESIPEGVVVITICLQSLMTVLIGSVTALRLFAWRATVNTRLTAGTILLVLVGATVLGLSTIAMQRVCS